MRRDTRRKDEFKRKAGRSDRGCSSRSRKLKSGRWEDGSGSGSGLTKIWLETEKHCVRHYRRVDCVKIDLDSYDEESSEEESSEEASSEDETSDNINNEIHPEAKDETSDAVRIDVEHVDVLTHWTWP